jgi:hypothetical protein
MDSVATMATKNSYKDLKILLKSISIFSPNIKIFILGDIYTCTNCIIDFPNLKITTLSKLNKYTNYNRTKLVKLNLWLEFMLEKCTIIEYALLQYKNVLFLDADIILLNSIENIITEEQLSKDIGLSKHVIKESDEHKYGIYNGGFIYVSNKNVTSWWRENSKNSIYFEQKVMDDMPLHFNCFLFLPQNNFGWWRLFQAPFPEFVGEKFTIENNIILYDKLPLNSIHTHFISEHRYIIKFNHFITKLIKNSNNDNLKIIFNL